MIVADHKRLHQLIVILLDNALKYTDTGDAITVLSKSNGALWQLEVKIQGLQLMRNIKRIFLNVSTAKMLLVIKQLAAMVWG